MDAADRAETAEGLSSIVDSSYRECWRRSEMSHWYAEQKALVVGISEYSNTQYDLTYARKDAEAIAALLKNDFGFDRVWELYDQDATKSRITHLLEDLYDSDEEDGILIFFAGHGVTVTSGIGDDRGFIVPHDGNPKKARSNIPMARLRDEYLPMIPAKHVFLVVDACYGGLAMRDIRVTESSHNIDNGFIAQLTRPENKTRQVLAAGTKNQKVLDGGRHGHSIFTARFIEAILEADPFTTADRIGVSVRERVARDAQDLHKRQSPQFGYLVGEEGSFLFTREFADSDSFLDDSGEEEVLQQVKSLKDSGNIEQALREAKKAAIAFPLSYPLRRIARDLNDTLKAQQLQQAAEEAKQRENRVLKLTEAARQFVADGDIAQGIACLQEAIRFPEGASMKVMLESLERYGTSRMSAREKAAELNLLFKRAERAARTNVDDAVAAYERILEIHPGNRKAAQAIISARERAGLKECRKLANQLLSLATQEVDSVKGACESLEREQQEFLAVGMEDEAAETAREVTEAKKKLGAPVEEQTNLNALAAVLRSAHKLSTARKKIAASPQATRYLVTTASSLLPRDEVLPLVEHLAPELFAARERCLKWKRQAYTCWKEAQDAESKALIEHKKRIARRKEKAQQECEEWKKEEQARVENEHITNLKQYIQQLEKYEVKKKAHDTAVAEYNSSPTLRRMFTSPPAPCNIKKPSPPTKGRPAPWPEHRRTIEEPKFDETVDIPVPPSEMTKLLPTVLADLPKWLVAAVRREMPEIERWNQGGERVSSAVVQSPIEEYVAEFARNGENVEDMSHDLQSVLHALVAVAKAEKAHNRGVGIKGLGSFSYRSRPTRRLRFLADPKTRHNSRALRHYLRNKVGLPQEKINHSLGLLAKVEMFCCKGHRSLIVPKVGTFSSSTEEGLTFSSEISSRSRQQPKRNTRQGTAQYGRRESKQICCSVAQHPAKTGINKEQQPLRNVSASFIRYLHGKEEDRRSLAEITEDVSVVADTLLRLAGESSRELNVGGLGGFWMNRTHGRLIFEPDPLRRTSRDLQKAVKDSAGFSQSRGRRALLEWREILPYCISAGRTVTIDGVGSFKYVAKRKEIALQK